MEKIEKGMKVLISPLITELSEWVEGEVIDVENNPFRGIVISVKDETGKIYTENESYFKIAVCSQ